MILKKTRSFCWFSSNSEVEATWATLIGWPHKTSTDFLVYIWSLSTPIQVKSVHETIPLHETRPYLKYQFWKTSTSEKWNSVELNTFGHICPHQWAWLLLYSAITPIGEDKYVQKCSTRQSFIFPKFTSFKIGTLVILATLRYLLVHPSQ
jgi:hypothetical protein